MHPSDFDVRRTGRQWTDEEFDARLEAAPEKIEFSGGIFVSDRQRRIVLGMLLENLGIDDAVRYGNVDDWEAAVAARKARDGSGG